jgi:hypothetical protein
VFQILVRGKFFTVAVLQGLTWWNADINSANGGPNVRFGWKADVRLSVCVSV